MTSIDNDLELDDAIVLLLGAPSRDPRLRGQIRGVTRLEKLIFLLERETNAEHWLAEKGDFTAYNFGPFSAKVYQAVDMLSAAEIIRDSGALVENTEESWEEDNLIGENDFSPNQTDPYVTRDFQLTDRGWRYYGVLVEHLPEGAEEELGSFKDRFGGLPLRQLVRYVYKRYDDFTSKSLIRGEVLGPNG